MAEPPPLGLQCGLGAFLFQLYATRALPSASSASSHLAPVAWPASPYSAAEALRSLFGACSLTPWAWGTVQHSPTWVPRPCREDFASWFGCYRRAPRGWSLDSNRWSQSRLPSHPGIRREGKRFATSRWLEEATTCSTTSASDSWGRRTVWRGFSLGLLLRQAVSLWRSNWPWGSESSRKTA